MRFSIAYHKNNIAGKNIVEKFKELGFTPQVPIIELKKETIFSESMDKEHANLRGIDFIVFASTHKSEKGNPSLCLHAPGNWRSADFGGRDGKICMASAYVMKYLFSKMQKYWNESKNIKRKYNLTLETTHHGPLIEIPCCFIEVGSREQEWNDKEAAEVLARAILNLQNYNELEIKNKKWFPAIGIGGPHYAPNFNKIQLNSKYAISHIIPEYALPLTSSMMKEAEEKTIENLDTVLIDWKGCGKSESRQQAVKVIEKNGLKIVKTKEV